jgi:hypothetical protein
MPDDAVENIVRFEPEELRRLKEAASSLADMSDVDRSYYLPKRAEELGVAEKALRSVVHAELRERAMRTAAENLAHERERKQLEQQRLAEQREHHRTRKEHQQEENRKQRQAEHRKRLAEVKAEREQRKAEKEAEEKAKAKAKRFGTIMGLPVAQHEQELQRLAARLGEDAAALREEFAKTLGVGAAYEATEPWPQPINTARLLQECSDKICSYVVQQEHQQTAAVLWAAHCWLYDHGVPTHSPLLALTSAEPDSGKTTLAAVIGRIAPRFSLNIEMTGPSLYRFVDRVKPTLVIDEADDLFGRKSDLKHIVNAGWTRGAKIPRQANINGAYQTVYFDPSSSLATCGWQLWNWSGWSGTGYASVAATSDRA